MDTMQTVAVPDISGQVYVHPKEPITFTTEDKLISANFATGDARSVMVPTVTHARRVSMVSTDGFTGTAPLVIEILVRTTVKTIRLEGILTYILANMLPLTMPRYAQCVSLFVPFATSYQLVSSAVLVL